MPAEAPSICPECGSENIQLSDDSEESVCSDCGFINPEDEETGLGIDVEREPKDRSALDKSAVESGNESAPETADEWRTWYPCPECQSTALEQITEQHLSVHATESGSYGGDAGTLEEYNYVECSDCGEVLLDEIGRD